MSNLSNKPTVKLVEPPPLSRGRKATPVDDAVLDAFVESVGKGWSSDGEIYSSRKSATYQAGKWKERISKVRTTEKLESRIWEQDGGDDPDKGKWIFALRVKEEKEESAED